MKEGWSKEGGKVERWGEGGMEEGKTTSAKVLAERKGT